MIVALNSNKPLSQNAFFERLGEFGFDFYAMLVVDVLHEWEVGVWKSIFIHLLRILDSFTILSKLAELDRR